jgi:predicted RNA-binding protein YlxR (DUF448 family)
VREQQRLVRLAADGAGGVAVNPRRATGRGAYLCPSLSCLEEALRRNVLSRALGAELPGLNAPALRQRISAEEERLKAADGVRTHTGS